MGATYGLNGSSFDDYAGLSLFDLSGQVDPETAQDALRTIVADIRSIADSVDETEVRVVGRRWRNEVVNSFGSNAATAKWVLWQLRRGRQAGQLPDLLSEFARVDLVRCRDVAHQWLSAAQPSIGVMGLPGRFVRGLELDARVSKFYWSNPY